MLIVVVGQALPDIFAHVIETLKRVQGDIRIEVNPNVILNLVQNLINFPVTNKIFYLKNINK